MKKIIHISTLLMLFSVTIKAQQLPLSSLYTVNKFQVNSAYAGFNECLEGYLSHRSQWAGIEGAPTTNYLSIHSGIAKNMGLGVNLVMDKTDIISKLRGSLSYAYRVKLGAQHNIRFGLSAGVYQLGTSPSSVIVDDISDDIVQSGNQSSIAFNNDFSIYYNYKKLQIGISIPQIVESKAKFDLNNAEGGFGLKRHIIGLAEYDIVMGENLSFQPSVLYKTVNGKQGQLDINGQVNYKKMFFVGVGYRTDAGLLARLGMSLKDKFTVAYAYEFATNNISSYSGGSHEIMLGVKFCKNSKPEIKKEVNPEPVIVAVVKEPIPDPEPIIVIETEPLVETKPALVKVDLEKITANLNTEFNQRGSMIRYAKSSANNSVSENEKKIVNKVVEILKANPELKLTIEGHSCDKGSEELNNRLSKKRAERVANLLVAKGIVKDRIVTKGKGESSPLVPNTSEINRIENRRVQLSFNK